MKKRKFSCLWITVFAAKKGVEVFILLKWNLNVSSLTFEELPSLYEPTVEAIGAQKFGVSKVGQNMKYQEVSEKRQIDGEMAMC